MDDRRPARSGCEHDFMTGPKETLMTTMPNTNSTSHRARIRAIAVVAALCVALAGWALVRHEKTANMDRSQGDAAAVSDPWTHLLSKQDVAKLDAAVQDTRQRYRTMALARPGQNVYDEDHAVTTSIMDMDLAVWDAGTYTLRTYCIGTGTLDITFSIDDKVATDSMECHAAAVTRRDVPLSVPESHKGTINITPSKNARCAMGYRVDVG